MGWWVGPWHAANCHVIYNVHQRFVWCKNSVLYNRQSQKVKPVWLLCPVTPVPASCKKTTFDCQLCKLLTCGALRTTFHKLKIDASVFAYWVFYAWNYMQVQRSTGVPDASEPHKVQRHWRQDCRSVSACQPGASPISDSANIIVASSRIVGCSSDILLI